MTNFILTVVIFGITAIICIGAVVYAGAIHIKPIKSTEKPPIGVMPFWLHNERRLAALNEAIKRYSDAGYEVPSEWIAEQQSLQAYVNGKLKDQKP